MTNPLPPRVIDIYHGDVLRSDVNHGDPVADFKAMATVGIWGVIHKATQGLGVTDKTYAPRMKAARAAGLLTGAYHFNTGDSIKGQVDHFFDAADPDDNTLMALDFEDNRAGQMTLSGAVQFLQLVDERLGRPAWIYSGNRIKETIVNQSAEVRAVFAKRHFWLCQYGPVARMVDANHKPLPWTAPTLWQFTGDGVPAGVIHDVPGILTHGIDINGYAGSIDDLPAGLGFMILDRDLAALAKAIYAPAPGTFDVVDTTSGVVWGVAHMGDTTAIAFRGSLDLRDWVRNGAAWANPLDSGLLGPVHPGFYYGLPAAIEAAVRVSRDRVILTGHSLGGARAALGAALVARSGIKPVAGWVSFGSPKPGFDKLAVILAAVPGRSYRNGHEDLHQHDLVTNLPLTFPPEEYQQPTVMTDIYSTPPDHDPLGPFRFHHMSLYVAAMEKVATATE